MNVRAQWGHVGLLRAHRGAGGRHRCYHIGWGRGEHERVRIMKPCLFDETWMLAPMFVKKTRQRLTGENGVETAFGTIEKRADHRLLLRGGGAGTAPGLDARIAEEVITAEDQAADPEGFEAHPTGGASGPVARAVALSTKSPVLSRPFALSRTDLPPQSDSD